MSEIKIKNYDVFIVRILQIIIPFLTSYVSVLLINLVVYAGKAIDPLSFAVYILLFDAKPIGLIISWAIIAVVALVLFKGTSGIKVKDALVMRKWLSFKMWVLTLGRDFE